MHMLSFPVTFLEARVPLCKTIRQDRVDPYPLDRKVKSTITTICSMQQFHDLIKFAASKGACLLKGELDQDLNWESRAGHTLYDKPTSWVVFDIDRLPSIATVEDFLAKIGVTDTSYVLQWSASYGIRGDYALRAHVFMALDKPCTPADLKLWLKQMNLQLFASELVLDSPGNCLKWGLDISVADNSKLIYVAPPICHPSSLNEFQGKRIDLISKAKETLTMPTDRLQIGQIAVLEEAKISELRKARGLDPKKRTFKDHQGIEYMSKPDRATINGAYVDGDFVRFNLNDGDSFAYFHPVGRPEIVYNFKGEPNYKTQELDPEYYYHAINAGKQAVAKQHKGKLFLGIRDYNTGFFYNGTYDQDNDVLDIKKAGCNKDVKDFLEDHGQPVPKVIPTWRIVYDPQTSAIDLTKRQVNFFAQSKYMKAALERQDHQPFPKIDALMRHVVGSSCIKHWYNWLAFMYQKRIAPGTAWVWHGTQGTGKGLIYSSVLRPLFGKGNTVERRMEQLEDKYNGHLENCLICFIDEAQVSESRQSATIMSSLKNQISEPVINIRRMHINPYDVTNHTGWIFASNMPDAVVVTSNDRRFNIAEYQGTPLPKPTPQDIADIEAELTDFAVFLRLYAVDEMQARDILKGADRDQMILISQPSADTVANHIKAGSLSDLWDYLPTDEFTSLDPRQMDAYHHYKALMYDLVKTGRNKLTRDDLQKIFAYCVGNVPTQPTKFGSYLKHHGIALSATRSNTGVFRGYTTKWHDMPEWFDERRAEIVQLEQPTLKVVK